MTLLTIAQDVADVVGISRPSAVAASTDPVVRRLLANANLAGKVLMRAHNWAVLTKEKTQTLTGSDSDYAFESDYDRLVQNTAWDRTNYWEMRGNLTPQEWQVRKSAIITTSHLRRTFRLRPTSNALQFHIDPVPESADSVVYEYVSKHWCQSSGGTGQAEWAADTDTPILDETLLILGTLWRFKRAQGLPYLDEREEYESELRKSVADDLALPVVNVAERPGSILDYHIPDGDFTL